MNESIEKQIEALKLKTGMLQRIGLVRLARRTDLNGPDMILVKKALDKDAPGDFERIWEESNVNFISDSDPLKQDKENLLQSIFWSSSYGNYEVTSVDGSSLSRYKLSETQKDPLSLLEDNDSWMAGFLKDELKFEKFILKYNENAGKKMSPTYSVLLILG